MINFNKDITYLTKKSAEENAFAKLYITLRKKEGRVLTNGDVKLLPQPPLSIPNSREWRVRKKSAYRFLNYLKTKQKNVSNVLDLGCGNGWFSNLIADNFPSISIVGLDVNEPELEQANKVFNKDNLAFVYADIFKLSPSDFNKAFDIIVLNACVQYFEDFNLLISTLEKFLKPAGEIHIIDSPFYSNRELPKAKQRTVEYYKNLGFPEMVKYYFHHNADLIDAFEVLYKPQKSKWSKWLKGDDSPFMWIKKHA